MIVHEMPLIHTTKMFDYDLECIYSVPYTVIESKLCEVVKVNFILANMTFAGEAGNSVRCLSEFSSF